jgi:hypothetical protein
LPNTAPINSIAITILLYQPLPFKISFLPPHHMLFPTIESRS